MLSSYFALMSKDESTTSSPRPSTKTKRASSSSFMDDSGDNDDAGNNVHNHTNKRSRLITSTAARGLATDNPHSLTIRTHELDSAHSHSYSPHVHESESGSLVSASDRQKRRLGEPASEGSGMKYHCTYSRYSRGKDEGIELNESIDEGERVARKSALWMQVDRWEPLPPREGRRDRGRRGEMDMDWGD